MAQRLQISLSIYFGIFASALQQQINNHNNNENKRKKFLVIILVCGDLLWLISFDSYIDGSFDSFNGYALYWVGLN